MPLETVLNSALTLVLTVSLNLLSVSVALPTKSSMKEFSLHILATAMTIPTPMCLMAAICV
jgi:hypothetical protein